jgi:polyferredoxin
LPEIILPLLGYNGTFDLGMGKSIADALFPSYISAQELASHTWPEWGHPRAYWHAYSFIFAWPLGVYTVFTDQPQTAWLIIAAIQTLVIIPLMVMKWGKGAYCGWICSCGGMAETMGDTQRHKMPHGATWNKFNMIGQVILLIAVILLVIRVLGWIYPESWMNTMFNLFIKGENEEYKLVNALSYKWVVDIFLAGILGFGLYFKYSGRTWCRFACPLAALMHIYSLFGRFAIIAEKSKCISCNQCTSVCHQGIDVMAFASKGQPMTDPQCVRCSACVQVCPTGTLSFGEIDRKTNKVLRVDKLMARPVKMAEIDEALIIEVKNV